MTQDPSKGHDPPGIEELAEQAPTDFGKCDSLSVFVKMIDATPDPPCHSLVGRIELGPDGVFYTETADEGPQDDSYYRVAYNRALWFYSHDVTLSPVPPKRKDGYRGMLELRRWAVENLENQANREDGKSDQQTKKHQWSTKSKHKKPDQLLKEARERQIANMLSEAFNSDKKITAAEIAKKCDCSPSTVVRSKAWQKRAAISDYRKPPSGSKNPKGDKGPHMEAEDHR